MTVRPDATPPSAAAVSDVPCSSVGGRFRSYGVTLDISASSPSLLAALVARLPPFAEPIPTVADPDLCLYLRDAGSCTCGAVHAVPTLFRWSAQASGSIDELLALYQQNVKFYVASRASGRVFLHAGAVGWQGRMILVPGASLAGKTTLTVALVDAGASYYSDEYAVIDRQGLVHAYPQDLGLRSTATPTQQPASAASLGWTAGSTPLPVGLVVLTRFAAGSAWRPRLVSRSRGLLRLMPHTVPHARHPERALDYVASAIATASFLSGVRGEASEAGRRILARALT